jgi:hypothetical protein
MDLDAHDIADRPLWAQNRHTPMHMFLLSFSSLSCWINISVGSRLTLGLFLICLARSAVACMQQSQHASNSVSMHTFYAAFVVQQCARNTSSEAYIPPVHMHMCAYMRGYSSVGLIYIAHAIYFLSRMYMHRHSRSYMSVSIRLTSVSVRLTSVSVRPTSLSVCLTSLSVCLTPLSVRLTCISQRRQSFFVVNVSRTQRADHDCLGVASQSVL